MANPEHVKIVKQGTEAIEQWREANPDERLDLSEADLSRANLIGANLSGANLSGANIAEAELRLTNLSGACLTNADLFGVSLRKAFLEKANLNGVDLSTADLRGADLSAADLSGSDLSGADLSGADFSGADLSGANLSGVNLHRTSLVRADLVGADLSHASLVETDISEATLTDCRVYGVSTWNLKGEPKDQSNLVITHDGEAAITVDSLEVAQFIYLMLHSEKIRSVLDTIGRKGVLIIGRFTKDCKAILHAIRDELRSKYDMLPIMFEFNPLSTEPTIKTLSTLAHMSRFVIADLTDAKSVLQELTKITSSQPTLPIQLILHESFEMPPMGDSFLVMDSVLEPYVYTGRESLIADLQTKVIGPAEERALVIEAKLTEIRQKYLPWQTR